jgi:hypothetical protein
VVAVLAIAAVAATATLVSLRPDTAQASGLEQLVSVSPDEASQAVQELSRSASKKQQAAFTDNDLTLSEYQASVQSTVQCIRTSLEPVLAKSGMTIKFTGPTTSSDRFSVTYSYLVTGGIADSEAVTAAEMACQEDNQRQVEAAYQVLRRADATYVAQQGARFQACLSEKGLGALQGAEADVAAALRSMRSDESNSERLLECVQAQPSINSGLAGLR